MSLLETFVTLHILAFILTFVRVGTIIMMMPGIGDSFVSGSIRLYFALGFALVTMPLVASHLPAPLPTGMGFFALIFTEFLVGALIGSVARILMSATDTAGMIASFQMGLSNAQLFNPQLATQGSLMGAFFSVTAATLLFTLDLHHLMLRGIIESYALFPFGEMPDTGSMADMIARTVSYAFMVAAQMSAPLLILILILYAAMGVMTKLMPSLQIFILAMPVQIWLAMLITMLAISSMLLLFTTKYADYLGLFFSGGA